MGERIIYRQNPWVLDEMVSQIKNGKGQKTIEFNRSVSYYSFSNIRKRFVEYRNRLITTLQDDSRFGLILMILNILYIVYAWKVSGSLLNHLFNLLTDVIPLLDTSNRSD